jgi:hypothetical protein
VGKIFFSVLTFFEESPRIPNSEQITTPFQIAMAKFEKSMTN